ncbi:MULTISPECIES: D-alanine--poly(phosphoribitol) ligase subunit DltC [Brochothrix]|uniref:D-alanyl carrier protein n=1 Tax=Brochothrix thermosphacta TaxID=2756 RepID=A0A2X0RFI7_BROTH|nr:MULTISPECIES: D-alanine--poly(phosphoribitol) ligase subunit DltC [Brochothrix]SLM97715.1 D-alanine--poly(phosphoribitol) ligase subunit 2 [Brachybacterium faecium]ANZ94828.1 D-alanine--poly(phosphoribitol) ligase subunit 2 [Brochothrix thermosphacta]ANZ96866.1 D-alanine--poly(phosphoribitol) ligase subunit 2 [Brochothrix thermosphacta]EUJ34491.1 D-alanine--poly(phosphoribitol) ligase subunit 2 [Brochothrix thermosphacta DSM 20171 = FSL F6-1036]MDO7864287.1 D-alanine--poly(phosphoribitol) l
MDIKTEVLNILEELTGSDEVKTNPDIDLFDEGLLDSMGTVQLLIEIESVLDITVPVSEFEREEWATPTMIIKKVAEFQ